jgi:hypothetical protein
LVKLQRILVNEKNHGQLPKYVRDLGVVEKDYVSKYNPDTNILPTESLIMKRKNNNAVNIILNSVSEGLVLLFSNKANANEI